MFLFQSCKASLLFVLSEPNAQYYANLAFMAQTMHYYMQNSANAMELGQRYLQLFKLYRLRLFLSFPPLSHVKY